MFKKVVFFSILICSFTQSRAMEWPAHAEGVDTIAHQPSEIERIIISDDPRALRDFIRFEEFDPNAENIDLFGFGHKKTALACALYYRSLAVINYLLPLTDDENLLNAFADLLRAIPDIPELGWTYEERVNMEIRNLFLEEINKRNIQEKFQAFLNKQLRHAIYRAQPASMQYLLNLGADRTDRQGGYSLIETIEEIMDNEFGYESRRALREMLNLLRTYAPDLKTRIALEMVNQVRTGQINDPNYFKNLPQDLISLMAKLASVDPEAEKKWLTLGMPQWPEDFREEVTITQSIQQALGEWEPGREFEGE